MVWSFDKRKKRSFFGDFDFEEEISRMQEEMERIFEEAFSMPEELARKGKIIQKEGPYVYGFSIRIGPDGKPIMTEFGNVKPKLKGSDEREPFVDVIEGEKEVTVIAEVPGVNKEDIKIKASEEDLKIKVDTPQRKYAKEIKLPCEVKPESSKASYKNGLLEVKLTRKEPKKKEEKEIKIE